jgi:uncharacterized tellurite resistance protein B-like protein
MLIEIVGFLGDKLVDKIFDCTIDNTIDRFTKESIKREYEKVKKETYNKLITLNREEPCFDNLQKLLDESKIVNVIFNLSYIMTNLSMKERMDYIDEYIESFYKMKNVGVFDLTIIKGKMKQQFEECFKVINNPSEESRKVINQILVQSANSNEYQAELVCTLKCDIKQLREEIINMQKLFPTGDVDLGYLKSTTKTSIDNLKVRFNREFNVDVELSNWLSKFCIIDDERKKLYITLKEVQDAIHRNENDGNHEMLEKLNSLIDRILNSKEFDHFLLEKDIQDFIEQREDEIIKKYSESENEYYTSNEYYEWRRLCIKNSNLDDYRKAFCADTLVITGEAGIGKSHSIAHFVYNHFYQKNKICIFVLGQHLNEQLDPVLMLEKYLHIPYTIDRFLGQLNRIAEDNNCIIPFIIEGINEGYNSSIWKDYFDGLVGVFEKYSNIKFIISIRKTYIKKCLPDKFQKRNKTLIIEHRGFDEDSTQAVAEFFDYYGIDRPTFPILYSDFYNPLFLHTLCKTVKHSGNVKIDEYSSFSEIFKGYISVMEKSVSERCKYMVGLKLVKKSVDKIIEYSLENNMRYGITIDKFYEIVGEVIQKFGVSLIEFVQSMIEVGLFYTELYGYDKDTEYIQFAYERYHNILAAQFLISDINTKDELVESISNGKLSRYFDNMYSGIVEELFVLVPEKYSIELLEVLEEEKAEKGLDYFLNSLVWRKKSAISVDTTTRIINKYIVVREVYFKKLLEKQLIIAPIEGHPLNSLFLHKYLSKHTMSVRDSFWVESLYYDTIYGNGVLNNLIKLLRNQSESYTSETKELIAILLVWSLAGTNNLYRENAVRSLVALMQNDLQIAITTIKRFMQVDDGYVKEGLYCSVYGSVLRSQKMSFAKELAEIVYKDIFERDEVYPHIIVRAHAKGIIDYLKQSDIECGFDIKRIMPPYNSKWYEKVPPQEEINKYLFDYKDDKTNEYMYSVNTIIHSMATNTGEKSFMYGDFGRYVFEGWVEPWEYYFIAQDLSNIVTKQIFETYRYNYKLHGQFDNKIKSYDRHKHNNERIGKKYQRIASFELLARLADNFTPGSVEYEYSEAYQEWSDKRFELFINSSNDEIEILDDLSEEYEEPENDVKKVFVPYEYEGPWQFSYRGIDPTVISLNPSKKKNLWQDVFIIPDIQNEIWASIESVEPNIDDILFVEYANTSYVVLEMYNTWESECLRYDEEPKEYFIKAVAVLASSDKAISSEENNGLRKYAEGRNNYDVHTVFAREYFWSDAYKNFQEQVERDFDEDEVDGFIETGIDYHCPMSYSEEVENVISAYTMPSKYIAENLRLMQLEDGKWYDEHGNLVCLDIQFNGYQGALLIRKDSLLELIENKSLVVSWGIYTEKKGYPHFYSTKRIAWWNGNEFNEEQYDTEKWNSRY